MVIETRAAAVTERIVEPVTIPEVALIAAVPVAALCASPVLFTEAVETVSEAHVTVEVRSWVLPSVNVPVALNCCLVPSAMEGFAGATAIEDSTAAVTVNVVMPLIDPELAVILAEPVPTLVPSPWVFVALLTAATAGVSEPHCAVLVTSWVVPSVNVPVAVNCWEVPKGILGIAGVTAIETRTAAVTFSVVEPVTEPEVAVTLVLPTPALAATPWLLTVAIAWFAVFQVTVFVRSSVLPSV
jgi:hypothetical protein